MAQPLAIELTGVSIVRRGRMAVRDVSFGLGDGVLCGLIGPSGSGKTTVMRAIVGTQRNVSGDVRVLGERAGSEPLRHRVAYTTQELSVYRDLTVRDNVEYFARILGATAGRLDAVLARLGLGPDEHALVRNLSGGQQQRVSLAVALLQDAEVLVLDEPTVGLDPVLRDELWRLFHELATRGRTLLISSHVMDEAERCERLLFMRDGSVFASGNPGELRARTGAATLEQAFLRLTAERQEATL